MTAESISRWLHEPEKAPDAHEVHDLLQSWPWFVPARVIEARLARHEQGLTPAALTKLQLYAGSWTPAYILLTAQDGKQCRLLQSEGPEADTEARVIKEALPADEASVIEHQQDEKPAQAEVATPTPLAGEEQQTEEGLHVPIQPLFTEDYFRHEGVDIPDELPQQNPETPQTLMVMMSFSEWLSHYKKKTEHEESEAREKRALRSMWQQEKLAAALEDDPDEIPEEVFEMAVSSITREDGLASESLAIILEKQEKWSAAADMYRKLAMKNPAKSSYFAARAEAAKKHLL